MAYSKGNGGGKFMDNGKGLCSYKDGTMSKASRVAPVCGPGMNADQKHANKLLQKAQSQVDSQRGKSGM
jgi:hypothetical protein